MSNNLHYTTQDLFELDPDKTITGNKEIDRNKRDELKAKADRGKALYVQTNTTVPYVIISGRKFTVKKLIIAEVKDKKARFYIDSGEKRFYNLDMTGSDIFVERNDISLESGEPFETVYSFFVYKDEALVYYPEKRRADLFDSMDVFIELENAFIIIIVKYIGADQTPIVKFCIDNNFDLQEAIELIFSSIANTYQLFNNTDIKVIPCEIQKTTETNIKNTEER